jgi:hypothetical protein
VTLQRAVFFVVVGLYVVSLLTAVGMLVGLVVNFFGPKSVNLLPLALVFFGCLIVRYSLIVWMRKLGGVPEEFRQK